MSPLLLGLLLLNAAPQPAAPDPSRALAISVDELRSSIGRWEVETDFLNPDGTVAKAVRGTYEFDWVVPDRVVRGKSEIPELKQVSALLLYVNEAKAVIEMVSVGAEGNLWTMTGPLGGETRQSQEFATSGGGTGRLRFTRSKVTAGSFESRMEHTSDGGKTWQPGNHQVFRRAEASTPARQKIER